MKLQLRGDSYFLDGKPVARDEPLELRIVGGWLHGRFVWNGDPETLPVLAIPLGGMHEQLVLENRAAPEAIVRFELDDAEFRRP